MKANPALVTLLLLVLAAYWPAGAGASPVRYDVDISGGPINLNITGFLVFSQSGAAPGNIMPDLIDWLISVPGFDFTPDNTQAGLYLDFIVDADYNVLDDNPSQFGAGVCFSVTGCGSVEPPGTPRIMFSRDLIIPGGLQYRFPSGNTVVEYGPLFDHDIQYSAPRLLVSDPARRHWCWRDSHGLGAGGVAQSTAPDLRPRTASRTYRNRSARINKQPDNDFSAKTVSSCTLRLNRQRVADYRVGVALHRATS